MIEYKCQNTQNDRFLIEYFFEGKTDGYFIEIGASDGIGDSATYNLETYYNWRGLMVEANTSFFELLKINRKSVSINKALSDSVGKTNFIESNNKYYSCIESNLCSWHKEKCMNDGYETKSVDTIDFATLLKENNCPKYIDLISMDIEGSEYKSLSKFPFLEYKTKLFIIENSDHRIESLLYDNQYEEIKNPFSNINYELYFKHKDI